MKLTTIKSAGLAHLSYVLEDSGEAAIIDPRIDLRAYLKAVDGARIVRIFETHRHEDLVSGAHALSKRTGAPVHHGTALDFKHGNGVEHDTTFSVGKLRLTVLHTPGHTDESISIAVRHCETGDSVIGVFTGDALFVNDVGRTDFYPQRAREVAGLLYDSLHKILLPLGDQAVVWPAHGAGSACGDAMADRDFSTLGYEREHNPRLQLDREAFIDAKVAEEHPKPTYFDEMERVNKRGHEGMVHLPDAVPVAADELKGLVIDVRPPEAWAACHIPRSLCLPVSMIPSWAGWWLSYSNPMTLVADDRRDLRKAIRHLARLGYTNIEASLQGGIVAYEKTGRELGSVPSIGVQALSECLDAYTVLDVRKNKEWRDGHIKGSVNLPLQELVDRFDDVPTDKPLVTVCGSGRRATLAAALLVREDFDTTICFGSMSAWKAQDLPTESC